jgi:hypothetical protein
METNEKTKRNKQNEKIKYLSDTRVRPFHCDGAKVV